MSIRSNAARRIQALYKTHKNKMKNKRLGNVIYQNIASKFPNKNSKIELFYSARRNGLMGKLRWDKHISSFLEPRERVDLRHEHFDTMLNIAVDVLNQAFLENNRYRRYLFERGVSKEILVKIVNINNKNNNNYNNRNNNNPGRDVKRHPAD